MITCTECGKPVYVGETERTFKERMTEHLKDIEYNRNTAVGKHFNSENHSEQKFKCAVIERIYDNSKYYRKLREFEWMEKLDTRRQLDNTKTKSGVLWNNYKEVDE